MKLTASYSICNARKKGEIKILTKSSSPHDKPIEKRSYTHARGTKNLALRVCLFLERECKDKWKKRKRKRAWKGVPRGEGWLWQCGISYTVKDEERFPPFPTFLDFVTCLFTSFSSFIGSLYGYISVSLSMNERQSFLAFKNSGSFGWKSYNLPLCCFSWFRRRWKMQIKHTYMSFVILSQYIDAHCKKLHQLAKKQKLTERKARDSTLPWFRHSY